MELTKKQIAFLNFYAENQMRNLKNICNPIIHKMGVAYMEYDDLYSDALKVLEESVRSYREDNDTNCSFKTFLIGNIKRSFKDWQRDRLRWKRCNLKTGKDGKLLKDEKNNTIAISNISLDAPNDDGISWDEKISALEIDTEHSEGTVKYLNSLTETESQIANLVIEGYSINECQEILHIPEKKFQRILNNMRNFEKRKLFSNYHKEEKIMENMENTVTMEKSKSNRMSISSIKKKINNQLIRFNHPLQRESEQWSNIMKGNLVSDILQGNPIPALTFAEQIINGIAVIWDLDGKQRCTTSYSYSNDGFKVSSKVRRGIIQYQAILKNEDGKVVLDENGFPQTEARSFDIRNKKFSELPEELQDKFMDYNFEIVQYLNCSAEDIKYHIERYNDGKAMNQQQKGIIHLGEDFATAVKSIAAMPFFKEMGNYTVRESINGTLNRVVVESIMSTNFLDDWKKNQIEMCEFIKNNATEETFETFEDLVSRLSDVATDDVLDEFNSKNSFVWFGLFGRFIKTCDDDKKFIEFMAEYNQSLHKIFDDLEYNEDGKKKHSSKDKSIVVAKIKASEELMNKFLSENEINVENNITEENETNIDDKNSETDMVHMINPDATAEDIEEYKEYIEDTVRVSSPLYRQCYNALLAIAAYVYKNETDKQFANFVDNYANNTYMFNTKNQIKNFNTIKSAFDNYMKAKEN